MMTDVGHGTGLVPRSDGGRSLFPFTHNEALAFVKDGTLPDNLADRLRSFLEFGTCSNCDGVRCMHFVMRDWWDSGIDDCDGWCCPSCSDLKETQWASKG